jgi:hypothetical protein
MAALPPRNTKWLDGGFGAARIAQIATDYVGSGDINLSRE